MLMFVCRVLEHRPVDYFRALPGLLSLLHKLPQLNTSYSLVLSSVLMFRFHLAPTDSLGSSSAIAFLVLLCSRSISFFLPFSRASCQPPILRPQLSQIFDGQIRGRRVRKKGQICRRSKTIKVEREQQI